MFFFFFFFINLKRLGRSFGKTPVDATYKSVDLDFTSDKVKRIKVAKGLKRKNGRRSGKAGCSCANVANSLQSRNSSFDRGSFRKISPNKVSRVARTLRATREHTSQLCEDSPVASARARARKKRGNCFSSREIEVEEERRE